MSGRLISRIIILYYAVAARRLTLACGYIPSQPKDVIVADTEYPSESRSRRELTWDWIRIKIEYDASVNLLNQTMKGILEDLLKDALHYFETTIKVRRLGAFSIPSDCKGILWELKDKTICQGHCEKKCEVSTAPPSAHYFECCTCELEDGNCNQGECGGKLTDVDFVLFVSVLEKYCGRPLAYAGHCFVEGITKKPVAGFMNICPDKFHETKSHKLLEWRNVIRHELIHALVFSDVHFQNFPGAGEPQRKGSIYLYPNVVHQFTRLDWETSEGPVKHDVYMVVTPKVTKEARRHFNCTTLEGAEIESQGSGGMPGSHWEKRIFENELMSGVATQVFALSRLTLALFEDSGWYKVDYDKAEDMEWGKNLGCAFATKSCLTWMKMNPTNPYPFCTELSDVRCSAARLEKVMCNLIPATGEEIFHPNWSPEYEYNLEGLYHDQEGQPIFGYGEEPVADFCPYYADMDKNVDPNGRCTSPDIMSYGTDSPEVFSQSARCFDVAVSWNVNNEVSNFTQTHTVGCFESICKNNLVMIRTRNSEFYPCYREGQIIHLKEVLIGDDTAELKITCPSCSELCGYQFCSQDRIMKEQLDGSTTNIVGPRVQLVEAILLIVSLYNL
ncbi:hypothetical protein V3C99_016383 [Haemonchus contortus]